MKLIIPRHWVQGLRVFAEHVFPRVHYASHRVHHRPMRLSWAKLLKRVFEIDMEHCPNCGGELKIIAAILEQPVIKKILTELGLQA